MIELDDPPETYPNDPTKSLYYRGEVIAHEGCITVFAAKGPPPNAKSEAAGKDMIVLGYSAPSVGYDLDDLGRVASSIGMAIIAAGGKELPRPPSFTTRCLRLMGRANEANEDTQTLDK